MLRRTMYLVPLFCLLLLMACGGSGTTTVRKDEIVLPKSGSSYQEVRHIVLRGTNQEIGAAVAQLSDEIYEAEPLTFASAQDKSSRNAYIQQYFPNLALRQKGVAGYYGWGDSDLHDTSTLWYDLQPVACSAIFFPGTTTANGHSFQARDMDFYTVDMYQFLHPSEGPGKGNKLFSRNFVLESYPEDGGYATMVLGSMDCSTAPMTDSTSMDSPSARWSIRTWKGRSSTVGKARTG